MAEAHSEELPGKGPEFKNKPLSDSRYDKEDVKTPPSLKHASSCPPLDLIQTDCVEEEPYQDLLLFDADSQQFMKPKQHSSKRPPDMEEIEVECVIIDKPEVVKKMINNGCISLSEVHAFHRPPQAACDAIVYLTIPFDYKQEFVDGSFISDGAGKSFLGRIFVLYYSTELDTLQILRPEISEHGGTFPVTEFCFGWLFGCESTAHMLRWDPDYDVLSVVLCKEAYLTGESKVSLLESQNVQRDLTAYLEYHNARLAKKSEMQFDDAQHSKRCVSALEFFKKCLNGSTIRSYEHLPIKSIFSCVKKLEFTLSVLDSKLMEIGKSRPLRTAVDQVREHRKLILGFDKNNLDNLKYYQVDVKATSIFSGFKPFGPFYLEPSGMLGSKQVYEAVLDQRQGGQEGKHWKLAVILCAFSDRSVNPTREIKKLWKNLRESGYTIIHVTERELRKEDFNTVIKKIRSKLKEGICGIKVWIIAHGEERGEQMLSVNDEFKKLVDLFITTDDGHEIKVPEFLSSLSGIAQESREKMNLEFPVICNICCCRGMKKDDMTEGGKIFSETPSDVHVMYSASSGQTADDNSTFIDEWVKYYAFDFAEKNLGTVATEIQNNVNDLNGMQRPRISESLKHTCLNGIYILKKDMADKTFSYWRKMGHMQQGKKKVRRFKQENEEEVLAKKNAMANKMTTLPSMIIEELGANIQFQDDVLNDTNAQPNDDVPDDTIVQLKDDVPDDKTIQLNDDVQEDMSTDVNEDVPKRVAADTALLGLAFLDTLQEEFADRQDILKCPHFPVSDVKIADNLMASGAILVSEIFEVKPPLIPRIEPFNTESFIRALIWEFVGASFEVTCRIFDCTPELLHQLLETACMPINAIDDILAFLGLDEPSGVFMFHVSQSHGIEVEPLSKQVDEGIATVEITHFCRVWFARCKTSVLAFGYNTELASLEGLLCKAAYLWDFDDGIEVLDSREDIRDHVKNLEMRVRSEKYLDLEERRSMKFSIKAAKFLLKCLDSFVYSLASTQIPLLVHDEFDGRFFFQFFDEDGESIFKTGTHQFEADTPIMFMKNILTQSDCIRLHSYKMHAYVPQNWLNGFGRPWLSWIGGRASIEQETKSYGPYQFVYNPAPEPALSLERSAPLKVPLGHQSQQLQNRPQIHADHVMTKGSNVIHYHFPEGMDLSTAEHISRRMSSKDLDSKSDGSPKHGPDETKAKTSNTPPHQEIEIDDDIPVQRICDYASKQASQLSNNHADAHPMRVIDDETYKSIPMFPSDPGCNREEGMADSVEVNKKNEYEI